MTDTRSYKARRRNAWAAIALFVVVSILLTAPIWGRW
jgi:hypothetical protein